MTLSPKSVVLTSPSSELKSGGTSAIPRLSYNLLQIGGGEREVNRDVACNFTLWPMGHGMSYRIDDKNAPEGQIGGTRMSSRSHSG